MLGINAPVSIRTLRPGDFYLLFPDLVTLGLVFADGEANRRFELNGECANQVRPIDQSRCIERFKGNELSFQIGGQAMGSAEPLRTGCLVVSKDRTRHFLAIQIAESQLFVYVDLQNWTLTATLPNSPFDAYNSWKIIRGWDEMVVHEFH